MEIGDISRFAGPKNLVSWAGLYLTVHQSGDRKYMGRMKKLDTATPARIGNQTRNVPVKQRGG